MVLIPFITRTLRPVAIRGVGCVVWCGSCQDTGRSDDADALSLCSGMLAVNSLEGSHWVWTTHDIAENIV